MSALSKEQIFYNLENPVTQNLQVGEGVLLNQSSQTKWDKEEITEILVGRIFWRSVGSAWNGTWSVMALAEPLKHARSMIVITSWVTWPSAATPSNGGFSVSVESEHLDLQNLREYPRYGIICAVLSDQWDLPEKWIRIRVWLGSPQRNDTKSQSRLRQVFPCPCYFLWISAGMVWMWVWMEDSQIPECL